MSGDLVLAGISATNPIPNPAFIEVNFAQGASAGDNSPLEVVLVGNKRSTGTAVVDTEIYGPDSLIPMQSEADVIALFGTGSELHRMWRRFTKINKSTTLRAIAVTESAGVAASAAAVIATVPTSDFTVRVYVGDEFCDLTVVAGTAVDTIGANLVLAVNARTHWPVVASYNSSTDTFTLTALQKGPRGNEIRVQIVKLNDGGTTFSALATDTALSSGATADDNTAALATLAPDRYYYIVSAANDATQLGAAITMVNVQALAENGRRQRVFAGFTGSLASGITLATGRNAARAEIVWSKSSDWTGAELAANHAAVMSLLETKPKPRTNFCNFGLRSADQSMWVVPAPRLKADHPTTADITSALNNGLSPIGVIRKTGATYLVNRITTRSLNGSQPDYRIRPAHKVTICDFFADDLGVAISERHGWQTIGDDVPAGSPPLGAEFVTPSRMRATVLGVIGTYDSNGLWDPLGAIRMRDNLYVARQQANKARMGVRVLAEPVDNYEQGVIQIQQVA